MKNFKSTFWMNTIYVAAFLKLPVEFSNWEAKKVFRISKRIHSLTFLTAFARTLQLAEIVQCEEWWNYIQW